MMPLAELLPDVAGIPRGLMIGGLVQDSRVLAAPYPAMSPW
jgi:UDP-N-acetylmuramoyl-L-alanyl-D-glutamate--2,6-diaminopimelate ligase